jgi:hypothetical protein
MTRALSNPFSTGAGGPNFENSVQSRFAVLMLTGGFAPCLAPLPIKRIKLQGSYADYETDDCIIFLQDAGGQDGPKLLVQIKHTVTISENDEEFAEVIAAAWRDFKNPKVFDPRCDCIALITGPLSANDIENARPILEWARTSDTADEFFTKVQKAQFSSAQKQAKLRAFRTQIEKANGGPVSDEDVWQFLKRYNLVGYDLDVASGATLSLLHSHIGQFAISSVGDAWGSISKFVASFNQTAGTLTVAMFPEDLRKAFTKPVVATTMPKNSFGQSRQKPLWYLCLQKARWPLLLCWVVGMTNQRATRTRSKI